MEITHWSDKTSEKKPKSLCEHKKNTKFWNKKQPYQVKRTSTILPERPTAAVEYWCDVIARRPLINTNSSAQFAGPFYVRFHKQNLNAQSVATFARVNERKLKLFNCSGDFSLSLLLCICIIITLVLRKFFFLQIIDRIPQQFVELLHKIRI